MIFLTTKEYMIILYSLYFSIFFSACSFINLPPKNESSQRPLKQYWLTTSMYAGKFYDDDKLNLVDFRPFHALDDAKAPDGATLYPPEADHVIKAGTLARIIKISYPDGLSFKNRPLYAPRENIWVYLEIAKERGNVSIFNEKPYILVIPKLIKDEKQLSGYLARFFGKEDPNLWILQLPSHVQLGIYQKRPVMGMSKREVITALGPAIKKQFQDKNDISESTEIWHYHNYFVVFNGDEVSKVKSLR